MTKVLELALMGELQISLDGNPLTYLTSIKAQALLCYLAVTGRSHSRQALAGLLWGEMPEPHGRRNLRGVVMKLRRYVEPHLTVTQNALGFNRQSDYRLDVESFRATLERRPGNLPSPEAARHAAALYRGDFLEDLHVRHAPAFEEWVLAQRTQLQESALSAFHALTVYCVRRQQYEEGIEHARRMLGLDPVREEGWRQLMLLLALNGQRNVALSEYVICRNILAAELGVEPSPETVELFERIRTGQVSREARGLRIGLNRGVPLSADSGQSLGQIDHELPRFVAGPPLTHPSHFFGRERELRRLFNMLRRLPLQNAAIIGPRRSGKTSLLHYVKDITSTPPDQLRPGQRTDWLLQPASYRWIFVDFQDPRLGTAETLLRYLLVHMDLPAPEPCALEGFLDVVTEGLKAPTVVLFDEIGVALQRYTELDDAFWESLRSLATNQLAGNLGFILAASQSPGELAAYSGLGSPFFNIFGYTATLGPLSDAEARDLIASSPRPFAKTDVTWILTESRRWPILLQILCRERLLALEEGETGDAWREDARRQILPFTRSLTREEP
jgi:DNA-binding SARP family transcriptional activator